MLITGSTTRVSDSADLAGGLGPAFLMSSQVMLMPKVQEPPLENHCSNLSKSSVQLGLPFCGLSVDITYWQMKYYITQLEPLCHHGHCHHHHPHHYIITSLPLTKHFTGTQALS